MRFPKSTMVRCGLLVLMGVVGSGELAFAQKDRITFDVTLAPVNTSNQPAGSPLQVRRGQAFKIVARGNLRQGFFTFPLTIRTNEQMETELWDFVPKLPKGLVLLWPIRESPAPERHEVKEKEGPRILLEHFKPFTWEQDVLVENTAEPGSLKIPVYFSGQACNNLSCLPFTQTIETHIAVSSEPPVDADPKLELRRTKTEPLIESVSANIPKKVESLATPPATEKKTIFDLIASSEEGYEKSMADLAEKMIVSKREVGTSFADLLSFILAGIFWGAVSLVTPCVFPMIPITVSYFLKQSEKEHHRPIGMALIYSGTIVVVLTLAAAFMLSVFRLLSIDPFMNYALGGLFIFFALSLFGMYEIELPSSLARFTSSHEGQGVVGTVFMALTFTIISFACVAPFLGGFGGTAAGTARPWWFNIIGGLAFSITFAAPFFVLAVFPTLLRKMPKSGSWLNTVKVVMGFLELAAAVKFCRSAELVLTGSSPFLLTFDLGMGIYIALSILCGLYLLGVFRLPHDSPEEHLSVPRMIFAAACLTGALYLTPSLFKDANGNTVRPGGSLYAWVESFLLPETMGNSTDEPHTADLPTTVAKIQERLKKYKPARAERIFIDFTGVNCQNCRMNEKSIFTKRYIQDLLASYTMAKIYTDVVPKYYYAPELRATLSVARQKADARGANLEFQKKVFNDERLPLYAIVEPQADGMVKVVGVYFESLINSETSFADFLRNPK